MYRPGLTTNDEPCKLLLLPWELVVGDMYFVNDYNKTCYCEYLKNQDTLIIWALLVGAEVSIIHRFHCMVKQ